MEGNEIRKNVSNDSKAWVKKDNKTRNKIEKELKRKRKKIK